MELEKYQRYFENSVVDQGLRFRFPPSDVNKYYSRFDFFSRELKEKTVIHVGCVDHVNLIERKIKKDQWVHGFVSRHAKRCLGFDINETGIHYLKSKLNYTDVFVHNVLTDEMIPEIQQIKWDYMLIGEVVEHIGNPVEFLSRIREKYAGNVQSLVITVPNAFKWSNTVNSLRNNEFINNDHRFWFSPYTILKVAKDAGFYPKKFYLVSSFPKNRISWISDWFFYRKPFFRDIIIAVLDFNHQD